MSMADKLSEIQQLLNHPLHSGFFSETAAFMTVEMYGGVIPQRALDEFPPIPT